MLLKSKKYTEEQYKNELAIARSHCLKTNRKYKNTESLLSDPAYKNRLRCLELNYRSDEGENEPYDAPLIA